MKLLNENGHLRPKVQFVLFAIIGVYFSADVVTSLLYPSSRLDRVSCGFELIALPGMAYFAWQGYGQMKKQHRQAEGITPPIQQARLVSRQRLDWMIVACVNLTVPAVSAWLQFVGTLDSTTSLTSRIASLLLLDTLVLLCFRARARRRGEEMTPGLIVGTVVLGILSALGTAGGVLFVR